MWEKQGFFANSVCWRWFSPTRRLFSCISLTSTTTQLYSHPRIPLWCKSKMDWPQLIESKRGKLQLFDQGFSLYKNKTQKNKHYFRCTITRCKASALVCGNLEDGDFEVVFHHKHKHQHETTPCGSLIKDFLAKFKAEWTCRFNGSLKIWRFPLFPILMQHKNPSLLKRYQVCVQHWWWVIEHAGKISQTCHRL